MDRNATISGRAYRRVKEEERCWQRPAGSSYKTTSEGREANGDMEHRAPELVWEGALKALNEWQQQLPQQKGKAGEKGVKPPGKEKTRANNQA
jgi:hypothetical protein